MNQTKYFIAGSSHAALEAIGAIRLWDQDGAVTLATKDGRMPYSPTVLPYVVSGHSDPDRVLLRSEQDFRDAAVTVRLNAPVTKVDAGARQVTLGNGEVWQYERLLLATGAAPAIPPVPGLKDAAFHVLRSMDDALALREKAPKSKSAVVMGAGLVGMHAAENLVRAGATVTVVEMADQVLPAYFDAKAAAIIQSAFEDAGATLKLGCRVEQVTPKGDTATVTLSDGSSLEADLLLVAAGVKPVVDYLDGSGVAVDQGILVDDRMATSQDGVFAAGDCAQARDLATGQASVLGIVPSAVEQGRIAGQAMAGDTGLKPWPGGVPINTYTFFGHQAISVGASRATGDQEEITSNGAPGKYRKILLDGGKLAGISAIDEPLDAGIMWQLILRGTDLGPVRADFLAAPLKTGRALMSRTWR